jgi:hypothetical protein
VAGFADATGYRQMAAQAGVAVCSLPGAPPIHPRGPGVLVVDRELAPLVGVLTAAEISKSATG